MLPAHASSRGSIILVPPCGSSNRCLPSRISASLICLDHPAVRWKRVSRWRRRQLCLPHASLSNAMPGTEPALLRNQSTRDSLRLAIPSKGRLSDDTMKLLQDCQLNIYKPNPRQYIAVISQMPGLEVWLQRASDVVRKLVYGDVDLGIVGLDMFEEIAGSNPDLMVLHEALGFGQCHLALGVPMHGRFADVHTLDDLRRFRGKVNREASHDVFAVIVSYVPMHQAGMWATVLPIHAQACLTALHHCKRPDFLDRLGQCTRPLVCHSMKDWTERTPLRVVTGYHNLARRFFEQQGFEHVVLLSADGALEAAPLMGTADIILDLVSTGLTLRENNLKELEGGMILKSQGVLVGSRRALLQRPGLLDLAHELMERLEAHLKAGGLYSVVANMRASSPEEVASRLLASPHLGGLQGPTIAPIYTPESLQGAGGDRFYAATVCVPQKQLYESVKELRKVGGSGVLVMPMTYVFDEEPARWRRILKELESHQ